MLSRWEVHLSKASGVISDLVERDKRGSYIGISNSGSMVKDINITFGRVLISDPYTVGTMHWPSIWGIIGRKFGVEVSQRFELAGNVWSEYVTLL